jgi:transcriptional regulator with XRE-family HTH domain
VHNALLKVANACTSTQALCYISFMHTKHGPEKGTKYIGTNQHHFGKILAAMRRKKGLTQVELAEKSGVSKRAITYYERETKNPSVAVLNKLATTLETPVEKFLNNNAADPITLDRSLSKRFEVAQRLPPTARNDIKRYVDNMAKAYGVGENAMKQEDKKAVKPRKRV